MMTAPMVESAVTKLQESEVADVSLPTLAKLAPDSYFHGAMLAGQ